MDLASSNRRDMLVLVSLATLLAGALLLGLATTYVVGAGYVTRLLPIPPWVYVASLVAPLVATLLVPLPALLYARVTAPRVEAAPPVA